MIPIKVYRYKDNEYTDIEQFRKVFKNVSFPKTITDDMVMARGVIVDDKPMPEETFNEKKLNKLNELNQKYTAAVSSSVAVKLNEDLTIGMLFAEKDLLMVRAMLDKMQDASVDNGVLVDIDDNVYMNLSKDTVNNVYQTMLNANFNVYMKLKQYQIAINSAVTNEDLDNIRISF